MIGDLIIWFALAIVTFYLGRVMEGLNNLRAAVTVLGDRVTAVEAKLWRLAVALVPPATTT